MDYTLNWLGARPQGFAESLPRGRFVGSAGIGCRGFFSKAEAPSRHQVTLDFAHAPRVGALLLDSGGSSGLGMRNAALGELHRLRRGGGVDVCNSEPI